MADTPGLPFVDAAGRQQEVDPGEAALSVAELFIDRKPEDLTFAASYATIAIAYFLRDIRDRLASRG